jgi:hypothetical protein
VHNVGVEALLKPLSKFTDGFTVDTGTFVVCFTSVSNFFK